jgi:hypothetical protein
MVMVGTASFESDRPEGKAIARVEVHYSPQHGISSDDLGE